MSKLRQVSKEEFEILTRFHPGEVRYYVDIGRSVYRNKGASVKIKAKPIRVTNGTGSKAGGSAGLKVVGGGRGTNMPIQLTSIDKNFRPGTKYSVMHASLKRIMNNDPTKVEGRTNVVKRMLADLPNYRPNQVNPFVTDCLKYGIIRYTGTAATQ
jgi:hypothetical protein